MKKNNEIITNDIDKFPEFENIRNAILEAREKVATTVNFAMVSAYWTIGKQLHEAMSGDGSIYGKQLIKYVSVRLSEEFGQGFDERNLRNMRQFYEVYPKWNTVCSELSWSHYRLLMRIKEQEQIKGRISIKEKLAEKKAVIEQRDKAERTSPEKETEKKSQREM